MFGLSHRRKIALFDQPQNRPNDIRSQAQLRHSPLLFRTVQIPISGPFFQLEIISNPEALPDRHGDQVNADKQLPNKILHLEQATTERHIPSGRLDQRSGIDLASQLSFVILSNFIAHLVSSLHYCYHYHYHHHCRYNKIY